MYTHVYSCPQEKYITTKTKLVYNKSRLEMPTLELALITLATFPSVTFTDRLDL